MAERIKRNSMNSATTRAAVICVLAGMTCTAGAAVWDANGGNGGDWGVAANWNPTAVPTAIDAVTIGTASDATHPVTITSAAAAASVQLGPNSGTSFLDIQADLTVAGAFVLHHKGTGAVTHSAGTLTAATFSLSNSTTDQGSGTYTLSGTGQIHVTGDWVGDGGNSSTFIQTGAATSVKIDGDVAYAGSSTAVPANRRRYQLASGSLTVDGSVKRNYGGFLFEQTGGVATIGTSLSLGNYYRTGGSDGPSEWIIAGDSSLNIGADVTLGWVGDNGLHPGVNEQGRFTLQGSRSTGSDVTVGGNWRQTGSGTPQTTGSLGTLQAILDADAVADQLTMRKIAVAGNVTFDSGSLLDVGFAPGAEPVSGSYTWTLMTWSGSLTNNGLLLDAADVANGWSFVADPIAKNLTVSYSVPEPSSLALGSIVAGLLLRRRRAMHSAV